MKPKTRARIEILNFISMFSITTHGTYDGACPMPPQKDSCFHGSYGGNQNPPIGSLCILKAAPFTKYYLSWLKEIKQNENRFAERFLLESIEDGSLCWWSNVAIFHLPLETSDAYPKWRWTDDQFDFNDKWFRAVKKRDPYMTLPCTAIFEDKIVTLSTRQRHRISDYKAEKKFDDYRKVKVKDMLDFYDDAVANVPKFKK
jgi:hypothetical protein